jgi:uncharacterized protein (DUF1810 family)
MKSLEGRDPYDLQRFLDAQEGRYENVLAELRDGQKQGHWIWFIFPQLRGLGSSTMSERYGISSLDEASAYLDDPTLGSRLHECTGLVNRVRDRSIEEILGRTDAMKFRSSMTLFSRATTANAIFDVALRQFFRGQPDPLTLDRL